MRPAIPRSAQVGEGDRQPRVLAPIDEERGEAAAQRGSRIIDGEDSVWQPHVPIVLAAVGEGAEGVPSTPLTRSAHALVLL